MLKRISVYLVYSSALATGLIMLAIVADVFGRFVLNRPIPGVYEVVGFLMAVIIFAALAYTEQIDGNIKVKIIDSWLKKRALSLLNILVGLSGAVIIGFVTWATGVDALQSWQVKEVSAGLVPTPAYPFKVFVPLGLGLFTLVILVNSIRMIMDLPKTQGKKTTSKL